ncbi:hypothetical protein FISHEDRAFT_36562, partial [Fistulina hepatica ATCC 64428]
MHGGSAPVDSDPFNYRQSNSPSNGFGYDICIECLDHAPWPSSTSLQAAEQHLSRLETAWARRAAAASTEPLSPEGEWTIPPRPPPNANSIVHLPFPSSPISTNSTVSQVISVLKFLER